MLRGDGDPDLKARGSPETLDEEQIEGGGGNVGEPAGAHPAGRHRAGREGWVCPAWRDGWAPLSTPSSLFCSPHPSLHHLHMQRRRGQVHRGKAHIPRCHAHLVVRPDTAVQDKSNAAGIERRIGKIPPPRPGHCHIRIRHRTRAKVRQIPTDAARLSGVSTYGTKLAI